MPTDPKDLVEAAKNGDKDAFGEIYRLFLSRIYRFVYYLVYDEHLAEDITQETFVKAWKALPRFSLAKGTLQAYLYTIARNLVIDNQRKKKEVALNDEISENIEAEGDLDRNIQEEEAKNKVKDALSSLEGVEKQIIILRYFEDLSFTEIAGVVKKNEGAIRVALHRTLAKLRVVMRGEQKWR